MAFVVKRFAMRMCIVLFALGLILPAAMASADVTVIPVNVAWEGSTVMLSCCAPGTGYDYHWTNLGGEMSADAYGVNQSTLFIVNATLSDLGPYSCAIALSNGTVVDQSEPLGVTLYGGQLVSPSVVSPTQDLYVYVAEGDDLVLDCYATGYPTPTYQWEHLDKALPPKAVGIHSSTLTIPNMSQDDTGQYVCNASNAVGSQQSSLMSAVLQLTTAPSAEFPVITNFAMDDTIPEGHTMVLSCCSDSYPLADFSWLRVDGSDIPSKAYYGHASPVLILPNMSASDAGMYSCLVFVQENIVIPSDPTLISMVPYGPPIISSVSASQNAQYKENVTLSCSATGYPKPSFYWVKVDGALPDRAVGRNSSVLVLQEVEAGDEGQYVCVATNAFGTAQSAPALVSLGLAPPSILATNRSSAVLGGSTLTLICSAAADPSPTYEWIRLDSSLPAKAEGTYSSALVIPEFGWGDAGMYACLAMNDLGRDQSETIYITLQSDSLSSALAGNDGGGLASNRGLMFGAVIGVITLTLCVVGVATGVVCFKGGIFGATSGYHVDNLSVWDVLVGKNKGQTLIDLIVKVEPLQTESTLSYDNLLSSPSVTWNIIRPYAQDIGYYPEDVV